jgi:hypothetical protein
MKSLFPCFLLFLCLLVLRQIVLLQQRRDLVSTPQTVIDLTVLGLSNCCELD